MKKLNTATFVEKAKLVHKEKYDYSLTNYINSRTKVSIKCNNCGNVFDQLANNHLQGQGCKDCASSKPGYGGRQSKETFIGKAEKTHKNKYTYDKVEYVNSITKVTITCPVHGDFEQRPDSHVQGKGCTKCASDLNKVRYSGCTETFLDNAKLKHGNTYNYDKTKYISSKEKVIITCPTHGDFAQTPQDHLRGRGCSSCAVTGFDMNRPGTLYYLSVLNGTAYKIGITNKTVKERFSAEDMTKITVLKTWEYAVGKEAHKNEQFYLKEYKKFKYTGDPLLSSGNSELFQFDVLGLDV